MKDTNNFYIFARNWPNDVNEYFPAYVKIYSVVMKANEEIIKNFIPCYSNAKVNDVDGIERTKDTIGLYDTVEGKFYVNKGTGTFGYGMEDGTYVAPTNN